MGTDMKSLRMVLLSGMLLESLERASGVLRIALRDPEEFREWGLPDGFLEQVESTTELVRKRYLEATRQASIISPEGVVPEGVNAKRLPKIPVVRPQRKS